MASRGRFRVMIKVNRVLILLVEHDPGLRRSIIKEVEDVAQLIFNDEKDSYVVHVNLYCDDESLFRNLYLKALEHGVMTLGKGMLAYHEAWTGVPNIYLPLKELQELPPMVRRGVLEHEIAHARLHGSLEYYTSPPYYVDDELLLYVIYCSVKDYEVGIFLRTRGMVREQLEYVSYVLRSLDEKDYYSVVKLFGLTLPFHDLLSSELLEELSKVLEQDVTIIRRKYEEVESLGFYDKVYVLYEFYRRLIQRIQTSHGNKLNR